MKNFLLLGRSYKYLTLNLAVNVILYIYDTNKRIKKSRVKLAHINQIAKSKSPLDKSENLLYKRVNYRMMAK